MKINKVVKVKLRPRGKDRAFILDCFDAKRFIYNTALTYQLGYWEHLNNHFPRVKEVVEKTVKGKKEKKTVEVPYSPELETLYQAEKKKFYNSTSFVALCKVFTKDNLNSFVDYRSVRNMPAICVQQALRDLDRAWKNFFNGLADKPTFKRKVNPHQSFRYVQNGSLVKLNKKTLGVKIGSWIIPALIPMNDSDFLFDGSIKVKNITISKDACGDLFASIGYETEALVETHPLPEKSIGIDMGIRTFATLSSKKDPSLRHEYKLPKEVDEVRKKREKLQKQNKIKGHKEKKGQVRTKGSNQYNRTKLKIAKLYRKETNIINDFQNKVVNEITNNHGIIVRENLKVENMKRSAKGTKENPGNYVAQKRGLNREISKQRWGQFFTKLDSKAISKGACMIKVAPPGTSQTCGECGHKDPESRHGKLFCCSSCGYTVDADFNGADNIEARGLRVLAEGDGPLGTLLNSELEKPLVATPLEESSSNDGHSTH